MNPLYGLTWFLLLACRSYAQEWLHHGGDTVASKYSPLERINRSNVGNLKVARTFRTGRSERRQELLSAFGV